VSLIVEQPWVLSLHALDRAKSMGLTRDRVIAVLAEPETDYPGGSDYPPGRRVATRDDLAVIYDPDRRVVVTVLFNRRERRARY
jgi:hypothetical protein